MNTCSATAPKTGASRRRCFLTLLTLAGLALATATAPAAQSIARVWDEEILSAIRIDTPHPPVHARNLFTLSVVMYDAWAAYDATAVGYLFREKHTAADVAAARREAISYAAYGVLRQRYAHSRNSTNTLAALDARMAALGYDKNNSSYDTTSPAGLGNYLAAVVLNYFNYDGARELNNYADLPVSQGGYVSVNLPMATGVSGVGPGLVDPNHWQPLAITNALDQNNIPVGALQKFLGAQWLQVRPFALTRTDPTLPWIDPGPPPRLGTASDDEFRTNVLAVIRRSSELDPDDGVRIDISPGAFGNNSLGSNDGQGHAVNPATAQAYPANVVKRGDYVRVLAEFWADGPNSETPPGHWNVLANAVADHPATVKRIGGAGPLVDDLEWDVKVYFALNAAVHEAACAAWSLKRYYDGWRPISVIRYMGGLGQSTSPTSPSYNVRGLPLISNLIELVTVSSAGPGGRHAGLSPGTIALRTWPGQPDDPTNQYSGVKWIAPGDWLPYQKKTFVTPAFPGYISGHSTFSRAGAEVLAAITGSPFFPGGMATFTSISNVSLTFEKGPSETIQLQWGTYYDAADQAGLSRLWGGIHPPTDDLTGRRTGSQCGKGVWALARQYFDGSVTNTPVELAMRHLNAAQCEVRYSALRGFYYKLQTATSLEGPFIDDPAGFVQATDTSIAQTNAFTGKGRFFRVVGAASP